MRHLIFKIENRLKYNKIAQRLFFRFKLRHDFFTALNIEPTNYCNLACYFCPQGMGKVVRPKGFMQMKLYKKIINELRAEPKLWQLFLNKDGEPLLHSKIGEMVRLAKEAKIAHRVEIFTNGLVLTEKRAENLIKAELDVLHISLDGFTEKTFKKIKGKKGLARIRKNILRLMELKKELKKKLPVVEVKMVVTELNKNEEKKFLDYWKDKADQVKIYPLHEWEGTVKHAAHSRWQMVNGVSRVIGSVRELMKNMATSYKPQATRYPCLAPFYNPAINWDGKVTSCCVNYKYNELILGDVNRQSLQEIWDGEKYKKLRNDLLDGNLKEWPTCRRCTYWKMFPDMSRHLSCLKPKTKNQKLKTPFGVIK